MIYDYYWNLYLLFVASINYTQINMKNKALDIKE